LFIGDATHIRRPSAGWHKNCLNVQRFDTKHALPSATVKVLKQVSQRFDTKHALPSATVKVLKQGIAGVKDIKAIFM